MHLEGKTALITGGGGGIGRATALELASRGCNVVVSGNVESEISETIKALKSLNASAFGFVHNLADEGEITSLVKETLDAFSGIDILITAAGVCWPKRFDEITVDEWDASLSINLRSMFIICQQVVKFMIQSHRGHIINIASTVALGRVPDYHAMYGASKYGVVGLTQALAGYAKKFGIKVSLLYPGIVETGMTTCLGLERFGVNDRWYVERDKWLKPEVIAQGIVYLLNQDDTTFSPELVIEGMI